MLTIAQPQQRQIDAAALPILIDDFLAAKRRQIAASSVDGYRQDLAPFLAWWQARNNSMLDDDSFVEMTAWIERHYLNGFGLPPSPQMIWRTTKRVRQVVEPGSAPSETSWLRGVAFLFATPQPPNYASATATAGASTRGDG